MFFKRFFYGIFLKKVWKNYEFVRPSRATTKEFRKTPGKSHYESNLRKRSDQTQLRVIVGRIPFCGKLRHKTSCGVNLVSPRGVVVVCFRLSRHCRHNLSHLCGCHGRSNVSYPDYERPRLQASTQSCTSSISQYGPSNHILSHQGASKPSLEPLCHVCAGTCPS